MSDERFGLGRVVSPPEERETYAGRYALTAAAPPADPLPVVVGTDWHRSMFEPEVDRDGVAWVKALSGPIDGGHAWCLKPPTLNDPPGAWAHYSQGGSSACSGFARCRASSLVEGRLFDGFALYKRAQQVDEWPGEEPAYKGTSVNAAAKSAQAEGLVLVRGGAPAKRPSERWKIGAYHWADSVEAVCAALHLDINLGYAEYLQSWGESHPHVTRITLEVLHELLFRRTTGDACVALNLPRRPGLPA